MNKRPLSPRKIAVVLAAVVAAGLFFLLWGPNDGLVSVLATVRVSRDVIEPLTAVKVDQKTEINDEILGSAVRGTCHTTGTVHVVLTPNPTKAEFELFLIGQSVSDTVGVHGPAEIASRAVTKYKATKYITFDGDEFSTTPATVDADTDLTIENVGSSEPGLRGRIVWRVAERQVDKNYEQSRHIAAQQVIEQVSRQFDETVQKHLDKLNRDLKLQRLLKGQIADHDKLPTRLKTTKNDIHVSFLAAEGKGLFGADGETFRTVNVGTQNGWIVIHIREAEKPGK